MPRHEGTGVRGDRVALGVALGAAVVVLIAGLAHGINMLDFPYYGADEGTYMSQAWAVATQGRLTPYGYWYDHAPLGWIQIAAWAMLSGGFSTFGTAIDTGRVLMLLLQAASTLLLYAVAFKISRSLLVSTVTALTFALSAYGIYYHRRVLLDNVATFWMLLSLLPLVSERLSRRSIVFSAAALGVSVLSKEVTIFFAPAFAWLASSRTRDGRPWLAAGVWSVTLGIVLAPYPLMALARGELFGVGAVSDGTFERVSLLQTLLYQAGRGRDGGIFDAGSRFWELTARWTREEPLLVVGGTLAALVSVLTIRRSRIAGIVGVAVVSFWAFLGRGGEVLPFYLVPLLPLLALSVGLAFGRLAAVAAGFQGWTGNRSPALAGGTRLLLASVCLALVAPGYSSPSLGFHGNRSTLWTNEQAKGQREAIEWIRRNVPPESRIIADPTLWTDLRDGPSGAPRYFQVHPYWTATRDPRLRSEAFGDSWRGVDYVIATPQVRQDARAGQLTLVAEALEHSTSVATFDSGGWPIDVRQVNTLLHQPASTDAILRRTWDSYKARFLEGGRIADRPSKETTSEGQSYALLRAVYMDDRKTFDEVWAWTRDNLWKRGDGLLAWRWGYGAADAANKWGVLDWNSATDADQDTALALLFASRRWGGESYARDARTLLRGIWDQETIVIVGRRVVVAGNWAKPGDGLGNRAAINPSYLAPYAYRIFAEADPDRPWLELVDSSYALLDQVRAKPELGGAAGLVPDWAMLDAVSGEVVPADGERFGPRASYFSYDATRTPWRLALDWLWFNDSRARAALEHLSLPRRELQHGGRLVAAYRPDGAPAAEYEALSMYSATLGSLLVAEDRDLTYRVFSEKITDRYADGPEGAFWGDPNNYYDQNWAWFGTALVHGGLGNLWAGQSTIDWAPVWAR